LITPQGGELCLATTPTTMLDDVCPSMVRAMKMSNFGKGLGNCSHLTFVLISDDGDVACVDGRLKKLGTVL
jgi:hypothetical protein